MIVTCDYIDPISRSSHISFARGVAGWFKHFLLIYCLTPVQVIQKQTVVRKRLSNSRCHQWHMQGFVIGGKVISYALVLLIIFPLAPIQFP